jgi:hypothetical protein
MGLTRQSVQRTADLLEADGLVSYAENPAHQRAKLATLTARRLTPSQAVRLSGPPESRTASGRRICNTPFTRSSDASRGGGVRDAWPFNQTRAGSTNRASDIPSNGAKELIMMEQVIAVVARRCVHHGC